MNVESRSRAALVDLDAAGCSGSASSEASDAKQNPGNRAQLLMTQIESSD
jgi:hypothetical protein